MSKSYLFILGADDPEMRAIERILRQDGRAYCYAEINKVRVGPGEAYRIDTPKLTGDWVVVFIECAPHDVARVPEGSVFIDHHRPGDPGYSLGASDYWQASSLGQLCAFLSIKCSAELDVIAAVDHCFASAVRGKCPGVSGRVARRAYLKSVAASCSLAESDILDLVMDFIIRITSAPKVHHASQDVYDCSDWDVGTGYTPEYLSAIAAAAISDRVILLRQGAEKLVLCGAAMPSTVAAFKAKAGSDYGLENIYGVPVRGYAGGYYKN